MKYHGGKNGSGVFQKLITMMPPHRLFVEAFLGSGAILRRKRPAEKSIAFELSKATISEFVDHVPADKFEPWPLNSEWLRPNGDLPGCGGTSIGFNVPGTETTNLEIFNVDAFGQLKNRFTAAAYTWGFYEPRDVLIYCDPPYPADVRSSKDKRYEFELMAESEHRELLDVLLAIPARVMLSGYDNDLYNSKLKGWRTEQIPTVNRAGQKTIETVWLNFPPTASIHDPAHVGGDFRGRWNVTKRVRNWSKLLKEMDAGTRSAVLDELNSVMSAFLAEDDVRDAEFMAKLRRKAVRFNNKTKSAVTPAAALPAATEQNLYE